MKPIVRALSGHAAVLAAVAFLVAPAPSLIAAQSSAIAIGAEGWFAGMVPPPGWHLLDYGLYYTADGFNDGNGDEITGEHPLAGFETTIWADVIRPIYVSNLKIFGGSQFTHLVLPIVDMEIESNVLDDSDTGLADIYFSPFLASWHSQIWHWAGGLDIIWPTADYDHNDVVHLGNDHITLEPAMAVTGLWPNGWTVSAKVMYDYHFEHDSIDYTSQQQIHTDFQAGKLLNQQWGVGVNGYWIQGLEDDERDGKEVPDSQEFAFALGPGVLFKPNAQTALILKSMFELETESRPEGVATWLRLIYSF